MLSLRTQIQYANHLPLCLIPEIQFESLRMAPKPIAEALEKTCKQKSLDYLEMTANITCALVSLC